MLLVRPIVFALAALSILGAERAFGCSACGCTLSSDWASQGLAATGGWRADFRFDYFNQDQLRSGTDSVPRNTSSATRASPSVPLT